MSVSIYPVINNDDRCQDYVVKINGKVVDLHTARVSAVPFNRRWPGHQRGKEQTELINFLSFSMDEPVTLEIIPQMPFSEVSVRPQSLGVKPETEDGMIRFTLEKPSYFTVEPYGRNHALHIFADPVASYCLDHGDSGLLYFGPGEHDVGMITLKSNQTLFIDEGAVVYACIEANDAENIRILGRGILDNSRNKEEILFPCNAENNDTAVSNARRKHTVHLKYCTNITIDGITIRNSLVYNIRPVGCRNLHISNVKIIGCWRYNSDGIDMHNCEDVVIENCFLRTFDDSICVKGFDFFYSSNAQQALQQATYRNGNVYDTFKNAIIRNCTIWNDWGKCLEIGAETRAKEIYDITFEDCNIIHVTGSVLDCFNVDYADVHNVIYQNIHVEYDNVIPGGLIQKNDAESYRILDRDYAPDLISVITSFHHEYSAGSTRRGINRDITFRNIYLYGRQKPTMYFKGYDQEHQTRDILIQNLYWNGTLLPYLDKEQCIQDVFTQNICYQCVCGKECAE